MARPYIEVDIVQRNCGPARTPQVVPRPIRCTAALDEKALVSEPDTKDTRLIAAGESLYKPYHVVSLNK